MDPVFRGTSFHGLSRWVFGIFPGFDKDGTVLGIKDDDFDWLMTLLDLPRLSQDDLGAFFFPKGKFTSWGIYYCVGGT